MTCTLSLSRRTTSALLTLAGLSLGCQSKPLADPQTPPPPSTASTARALGPCDPVDIERSLVVRDQATLAAADFGFARTIASIRNTSGGAAIADAALVDTLLDTMTTTVEINPVSGLAMAVSTRLEANLSAAALLATELRPIALFNRFDLAPADGSHCGEYRIVYGRYPNAVLDRFLLIFEAALPNPTPAAGIAGCLPVAQFWHGLSDPALTPAQRAAQLANFYFVGLPGFSPVVSHTNYGVPFGQVRSNMFRQQPWQLREWRTSFNGAGQPVFVDDTVKQNPLAQLYNESSPSPNPALFATEQLAFRAEFTAVHLPILAENTVPVSVSPQCDRVNAIHSAFPDRYNEFQSVSQGTEDDPTTLASTTFRNAITGALGAIPLTATQVLDRAGTQACMGCHQVSVGRNIGFGQVWPGVASGGFVHVNEQGAAPPAITPLSPALTSCFLPARRLLLEGFVCGSAGSPDAGVSVDAAPPADASALDASSSVDASAPDGAVSDAGGQSCGGRYGQTCGPSEYCEFGPYNVCGASGPGVCAPRPASCSYGTEVCGCDSVTYPSQCHAQQAGTDVAASGACAGGSCSQRPPAGCCFEDGQCGKGGDCVGATCGVQAGVCKAPLTTKGSCWEDDDCGSGMVCDGEIICPCGARCLRADQPGVCTLGGRKTVSTAKSQLLAAPSAVSASELEQAVRAARAEESAKPGAFWPRRSTH